MNKNVGKVFNLTGGGSGGSLKLLEIEITKPPRKTVYKSGETFDPTGMVVSAGYGYGLSSDVTGYTVSPSVLTDGVTEVIVAYTENRVTKTFTIPVKVEKVLASIVVTTPPTKTVYSYLESFDTAGMMVDAVFSDGSRAAIIGYSYPSTSFTTIGKQEVSLTYTYEGITKSLGLEVTVNAIQVPVPVQNGTLTYTGGVQIPS